MLCGLGRTIGSSARRREGFSKHYLMIRDLRGQGSPKDDPSQVRPAASCVGKVVTSCFQQELGF